MRGSGLVGVAASLALAGAAAGQTTFEANITFGGGPPCDEGPLVPVGGTFSIPRTVTYGPRACTQFNRTVIYSGVARASRGWVGVDVEASLSGAGSLDSISASASTRFEVTFTAPGAGTVDVLMNLRIEGNIQEPPAGNAPLRVTFSVGGPTNNYSGSFFQVETSDGGLSTSADGFMSGYSEIVGKNVSLAFTGLPTNTPLEFVMGGNTFSLPLVSGAVNFANGMRLRETPFTITAVSGAFAPSDVDVDAPGANITNGSYGGGACSDADLSTPLGQLDIFDVLAYLELFEQGNPAADLAEPMGMFDIFDVLAYLAVFDTGC